MKCALCSNDNRRETMFDAKTKLGPWAYMCEECFKDHGIGLGLGKGHRLKKEFLDDEEIDLPRSA